MKTVWVAVLFLFLSGCARTGSFQRGGPWDLTAVKENEIRTRSWKVGEETLSFADLKTYELLSGRTIAIASYGTNAGHVSALDIYLRGNWGNGEKRFYLICHDRRAGRIVDVTVSHDKEGSRVDVYRKLRYALPGKPWVNGTNTYSYYVDEAGRVTESFHDYYSADEAGN